MKRMTICTLLVTLLGIAHGATESQGLAAPTIEAIAPAAIDRDVDRRERAADRDYEHAEHLRERQEDAEQHSKEQEDKARGDAGTIAVLAITAFIFVLQWRDMASSREVSERALEVSQGTLRVSQSEILFKHALEALEKAYDLIANTMDEHGNLDPRKGNLGNWGEAARLLVNAQFLRNRFLEEQHRLIYDEVERPRYVWLFASVLKLPESFESDQFHRLGAGMPGLGVARLGPNDFISESCLTVVYHFAKGWHTTRDNFGNQPPLGELASGAEYHRGVRGMLEYAAQVRYAFGESPLTTIEPAQN